MRSHSNVSESTVNSGLWSPTSMLYDRIRLPFDTGSFQTRRIDRGVDVARTELTAAGLLIGDWDQLTLLNGPAPAEFTAYLFTTHIRHCTDCTVLTTQHHSQHYTSTFSLHSIIWFKRLFVSAKFCNSLHITNVCIFLLFHRYSIMDMVLPLATAGATFMSWTSFL